MKERLTKRVGDGVQYDNGEYTITCYPKNNNLDPVDEMAVKLCGLEDKIENGTLIELPCAVGDTVYIIDEGDGECTEDYVLDVKVQNLIFGEKEIACVLKLPLGMRCSMYTKIGVNVFLTKEEAEKALKEKQR